jgi:hypothetical protein
VPVLASIFLLLSAFVSQALTPQTTRNVINGSAPYLTFDGGRTRATNVDALLSITLPSGTRITPSTNTSSASNPIELQYPNKRFTEIGMYVPPSTSLVALNTLIGPPNNYWDDDDGDGQGSGGITVTGNLMLSIVDKEGKAVDRRDTLDICKAPYKVTLSSSGGRLSTHYGVPKHSDFSPNTATYYISPKVSPKVCFARPSLSYGSSSDGGSSYIWNPDKGFLPQSTDPAHYDKNFPTTGSNNLYFYLDIAGVDPSTLSWPSVTHSGITASMTVVPPTPSTDYNHIFERPGGVRVTLTGPVATELQVNSDFPSNIPRPFMPVTFELVGRDSRGRTVIKYGFKLKQWFVNRGRERSTYSNTSSWCNRIGYQLPRIRDLTNLVSKDSGSSTSGASRHIDAGFFTEWGTMIDYTSASFADNRYYWTSDAMGSNQFDSYYVVCTSHLRP